MVYFLSNVKKTVSLISATRYPDSCHANAKTFEKLVQRSEKTVNVKCINSGCQRKEFKFEIVSEIFQNRKVRQWC